MSDFVVNDDLFGCYAMIDTGHDKADHIYKIVSAFKSNSYCDVPLTYQSEHNRYVHDEMTDVLNVIHCGIDESNVIRVAVKDVNKILNNSRDRVYYEKPTAKIS